MAKSLRSKSKMAFRRKKRTDPKSEYAMRDAIRTSRLSEKLKVLKAVERSDDEDFVDESGGEDMEDAGDENAQTATTSEQSANGEYTHPFTHTDYTSALDGCQWSYALLGLLCQESLTLADSSESASWQSGSLLSVRDVGSVLSILWREGPAC